MNTLFRPLALAVLGIAACQSLRAQEKIPIDRRTPIMDLLPARPLGALKPPVWIDSDLAQASEVMFGAPIAHTVTAPLALFETERAVHRINTLNLRGRDGFMEALIARRADLAGLPFRMGDACRTEEEQATLFSTTARDFRRLALVLSQREKGGSPDTKEALWRLVREPGARAQPAAKDKKAMPRIAADKQDKAFVAAAMQILGAESAAFRVSLARFLANVPNAEASQALARLAIFAPEPEVRSAALVSLKNRPAGEYTGILLQGFEYPLPAVAERSADALVTLKRKDVAVNLIKVLDQPDPRLPVKKDVDNVEVHVVRELVKVNHHRNCLLCHAPGNTQDVPKGVLRVPVPLPSEPLPTVQYYQSEPPAPNIVVRVDVTYLRQDFSMLMPVNDAKPWPDRQRFDFLVRARELTPKQAAEFRELAAKQTAGEPSPYHRAAIDALRRLTGRDAEPTAPAWRKALRI